MTTYATVIVAAYKAADVLPRCIQAAQGQINARVEVVVVDDASNDETLAVAQSYPDVRTTSLNTNNGPAAARNHAIAQARGDWIVVLDADDTMKANRIAELANVAEKLSADVVLGNFIRVDKDEKPIDSEPFLTADDIDTAAILTLETYVAANTMAPDSQNWGYLKPMFRRTFLEDHGIQYDETLRNSEDYHIILAALRAGARVAISAQPDYLYQVAAGSISHRVAPELIEKLIAADDRFTARLGDDASPELRRLLAARRCNLVNILDTENVMITLKKMRFGAAFRQLFARPQIGSRVLRQLREAVGNRFT